MSASPVDLLLARLDRVARSGQGWRAACPSCGGATPKLSIAESQCGAALLHCFGGCPATDVLGALGLEFGALYPTRSHASPEDRRRHKMRMRDAGWGAALSVVSREAAIVEAAARLVKEGVPLHPEDEARLQEAIDRVDAAKAVLCDR